LTADLAMGHRLTFAERFVYDPAESGITVPSILTSGTRSVHVDAKVDTGAQFCLFSREIGELLGLDVGSGLRREMGTLAGRMTAYGHQVTLETLGMVFSTFVLFSEEGRAAPEPAREGGVAPADQTRRG
jgi:hypothetical protein